MRARRRRLLLLLPLLFAALLGMHTLAMSLTGTHPAPDRAAAHSPAARSAVAPSAVAHSSTAGPAHHRMVLPFAAASPPATGPTAEAPAVESPAEAPAVESPAEEAPAASIGQHPADTEGAAVAVASWCLLALAVLLRLVRPRAHLLRGLLPSPRTPRTTWVPTARPARPPSLHFLSISRT